MTRIDFDRDLQGVQDGLITLGDLVEQSITRAMDALKRRDLEASRRVIEEDDLIDQKGSAWKRSAST